MRRAEAAAEALARDRIWALVFVRTMNCPAGRSLDTVLLPSA